MKSALVLLVLLSGCATAGVVSETALPRLGMGLHATEDLYAAACTPEPLPKLQAVCESAKSGINEAVSVYTEINDAVKAAQ